MSANDDYPCLNEGSSIHDWDEQYGAMCEEIDRLRAAVMPQGLIIHPGDTLIVRHNNVTIEQATDARDRLLVKMPGLADVLVICADEIAVYRPNVTAEATP